MKFVKKYNFWVVALLLSAFISPARCETASQEELARLYQQSFVLFQSLPYEGAYSYFRSTPDGDRNTVVNVRQRSSQERKYEIVFPEFLRGLVMFINSDGFWGTSLSEDEKKKFDKDLHFLPWNFFFPRNDPNKETKLKFLLDNYSLSMEENKEQVAERKTFLIRIDPQNRFRHSYLIYLDDETKFLLKQVIMDEEKKALEKMEFQRIRFDEKIAQEPLSTENLVLIHPYRKEDRKEEKKEEKQEEKKPSLNFTPLKVEWLPRSFQKIDEFIRGDDEKQTLHTLYSDGLAELSIFQRKQTKEEKEEQEKEKRGDQVKLWEWRGRAIFFCDKSGLRITAIGDLPNNALSRTLNQIKPQPDNPEKK